MKDALFLILEKFVINNNYKVDPSDFKLQLVSNPSYPSVKAISDTLDYFSIENIAANVPKDALDQMPICFLAILEIDFETSIAQVVRKKGFIKLLKSDGSKEKLSAEAFKEHWNGTIIAIEPNTGTVKNRPSVFFNPLIALSTATLLALAFATYSSSLSVLGYSILVILGCCLSYFIVREELGIFSEVSSKICDSASNNTSCGEVINSKSSTLFNKISLSDASITFFVSGLLIIMGSGYNAILFSGLALLSLPIVGYSIYAQKFIIKKWCPFCLGIAGVLLLQFALTITTINFIEWSMLSLIKSALVFPIVYLVWRFTKSHIKSSLALESLQTEYMSFKRNEALFDSLLYSKELPSIGVISKPAMISFGNKKNAIEINAVTNPLCGYCTKSFEGYDFLLKNYGDRVKINFIFFVTTDSLESNSTQIAQRIVELYKESWDGAYAALKEWFQIKDPVIWQAKYGIPKDSSDLSILKEHSEWCKTNEINYTPATLVGRHFFPAEYETKDLSLFIDHLIEQQVFAHNDEKIPSL